MSLAITAKALGAVYCGLLLASPTVLSAQTPVTTTAGGTTGSIPTFSNASNIEKSTLYYNKTGLGVGRYPSQMLDVNGNSVFRGYLQVSRTADATPTSGTKSYPIQFNLQVYNTAKGIALNPFFNFQAEPTGNNTASTGATLNLLYFGGVGAPTATETGLYFNTNGVIHFAPAQTFPITTGAQGPAGPQGPPGPSGTAGPNIAVSGTVSADSGLIANLNTPSGTAVTALEYATYGTGVYTYAGGTHGVGIQATGGEIGLVAIGTGYAGQFYGDVYVSGTLSKPGGSFKIDDPLDPENKYLSHSFVESPDMMNIYNGNAVTDANGSVVVTMPDYFEALNRDFRYQLTVMGQFAQAIVGSKISNGAFTIRTDKPNVEVSWQVTGVRQDAWANAHRIPTEEAKPAHEKGRFLHPELFHRSAEYAITGRSAVSSQP